MPFGSQYKKAKELGIVEGICKACAMKMGTLEEAKRQGLKLLDDMNGHPSMEKYIEKGYKIITL